MTYNQVQLFQINDYANHYADIEITGYRELYSKNCKQQCVHVCVCVHACLCVAYMNYYTQEFMLAITQLSHFSDLANITTCILHGNSMIFDMYHVMKSFH